MGATGFDSRSGQSQQRRAYPGGQGSRRGGSCGGGTRSRPQTDKTRRRAIINWPLLTGMNPQPLIKAKETITGDDNRRRYLHGLFTSSTTFNFSLDVLIAAFQFWGTRHSRRGSASRRRRARGIRPKERHFRVLDARQSRKIFFFN